MEAKINQFQFASDNGSQEKLFNFQKLLNYGIINQAILEKYNIIIIAKLFLGLAKK